LITNAVEMGQGTLSTLRLIATEELTIPTERIVVEQAPVTAEFFDPNTRNYATYGSIGFRLALRQLGPACAAARDMLIRAAAQTWQVAPDQCQLDSAQVVHPATGRALPFASLLALASTLTPPEKPVRKPSKQWSALGQSVARADIPSKTDGTAVFGIDVQRPGMLVACVLHAPTFGGRLVKLDSRPALTVKGVHKVVRLPGAIAVVAHSYWSALKAARALQPVWADGPHARMESEAFRKSLLAAAQHGAGIEMTKVDDPRIDPVATGSALKMATHVIDNTFDVPFLAHATMEPMNATVAVHADSAELWLSTQSAKDTQAGVAKALGLAPEKVTIHPQLIGGGFGRRLEHAFAIEAALIAREVGRPVKMIWSREVDMRAGGYRPAAAARVQLALGPDGMPTAVSVDCANPSLLEYSGLTNGPPSPDDWSVTMGWSRHAYDIALMKMTWSRVDEGVPCGYFRSVGASQNVFFFEHSIDLAARTASMDPMDYRRRLFAKNKRRTAFVNALAQRAGWGKPLQPGHFQGVAISQGNSAISGHVVEISVPEPGKFKLHHVTAAIDVGVVASPNAVEAQLMGGTLFGLSAALFSEIELQGGRVVQGNFDTYQVARMGHVPPMEFLVMGTAEDDRPEGAGEDGVASIAPAIANALLAASGKSITRLPLSRAGWELLV
jgi:isoquinoline 1-oxidoreductase beta subunit